MELTASEKSLLYNGLLALIDNNKLIYDYENITLNENDDQFMTEHITLYNEIKLAGELRHKLQGWKDNKVNQVKPLYLVELLTAPRLNYWEERIVEKRELNKKC